jgi:hypothetical protein
MALSDCCTGIGCRNYPDAPGPKRPSSLKRLKVSDGLQLPVVLIIYLHDSNTHRWRLNHQTRLVQGQSLSESARLGMRSMKLTLGECQSVGLK